jgi:hypothetical protein
LVAIVEHTTSNAQHKPILVKLILRTIEFRGSECVENSQCQYTVLKCFGHAGIPWRYSFIWTLGKCFHHRWLFELMFLFYFLMLRLSV